MVKRATKVKAARKTKAKPAKTTTTAADQAAYRHFLYMLGELENYESPVTPDTAMKLSVVYQCVSVIARSIASAGWHTLTLDRDGGKQCVDPLTSTVAWLLRYQPNSMQNDYDFKEAVMLDVLLRGNALVEIERDSYRRVTALWHVGWDRVTVVPEGYFVDLNTATEVFLFPDEVLHFKNLGGKSPIALGAGSLRAANAKQDYATRYFNDGFSASLWVDLPGKVKAEERQKLKQTLDTNYTRKRNAGRVIVTDGGVKLTPMETGISNTDAQLIESEKVSASDICRWFGVPETMVGVMERATWGNLDSLFTQFRQTTLAFHATQLERETDSKLFGQVQRGRVWTKINLSAVLRGDPSQQTVMLKSQVTGGLRTINEAREELDLNPLDGGDTLLLQGAMVPLERLLEPPATTNTMPYSEPDGDEEEDGEDEDAAEELQQSLYKQFAALLRVDQDKARRASNRGEDMQQWIADRFDEHNAGGVRSRLNPCVSAYFAAAGKRFDPQAVATAVKAYLAFGRASMTGAASLEDAVTSVVSLVRNGGKDRC